MFESSRIFIQNIEQVMCGITRFPLAAGGFIMSYFQAALIFTHLHSLFSLLTDTSAFHTYLKEEFKWTN